MNSNRLKLGLAVVFVIVVVTGTFVYGNAQRAKQNSAPATHTMSVVQPSASDQAKLPDPSASQPQPLAPSNTTKPALAPASSAKTPASGPADSLIPTLVLATLTAWYFIGKRKAEITRVNSFTNSAKSDIVNNK